MHTYIHTYVHTHTLTYVHTYTPYFIRIPLVPTGPLVLQMGF